VASGAIQPGFQQAAIACEATSLLETAPGHATRCADTAFTAAFAAEKARLGATGATPQERWAALEQLNLGRLRIAAKGLRRDGDAIVAVDAATQAADGMYMIGQVAALRSATCSIAELHHQVSGDGKRCWRPAPRRWRSTRPARCDRAATPRPSTSRSSAMAAIFPGAGDTDAYWANIVGGHDSVGEVPASLGRRAVLRPRRDRRRRRQEDPVQVGRLPAAGAVRSARLRHPAALARGDRAGAAAQPRGGARSTRRLRRGSTGGRPSIASAPR
jgi:hypothetical protein